MSFGNVNSISRSVDAIVAVGYEILGYEIQRHIASVAANKSIEGDRNLGPEC